FLKCLPRPHMATPPPPPPHSAGKPIVNNVVTHVANLQDPEVNAANDNIQEAALGSLANSDIMPQIAEWPEIGDILSAAITEAAAGGDVEQLMTDAAERAEKILKRAGYY
ncbi:MAG: ABC transporter substrate-binding protein, partial [Geminicoccaceae bacterium]